MLRRGAGRYGSVHSTAELRTTHGTAAEPIKLDHPEQLACCRPNDNTVPPASSDVLFSQFGVSAVVDAPETVTPFFLRSIFRFFDQRASTLTINSGITTNGTPGLQHFRPDRPSADPILEHRCWARLTVSSVDPAAIHSPNPAWAQPP